jgi:hypothetical protein
MMPGITRDLPWDLPTWDDDKSHGKSLDDDGSLDSAIPRIYGPVLIDHLFRL